MARAAFEHELFLSARRDAHLWRLFGVVGILTGLCGVAAVAALAPLKEVRAVPFSIDADTKLPVLLTESTPMKLEGSEAAALAEIARYVIARETYDAADNQERLTRIAGLSKEGARASWSRLWSQANDRHPDKVYGVDARVLVEILNVAPLRDGLVQVRLKKTLSDHQRRQSATYVATVGFGFEERIFTSMDRLLANPFGFYVETYRIDAETGGGDDG